jgi:hypothetical protein
MFATRADVYAALSTATESGHAGEREMRVRKTSREPE